MVENCRLQAAVVIGDGHCQGVGGGVVAMVRYICIARGLFLLFRRFSLSCSGFDSGALAGLPCCLCRDKLQVVLRGIFAWGRDIRVCFLVGRARHCFWTLS
jgi:hypothetical protein